MGENLPRSYVQNDIAELSVSSQSAQLVERGLWMFLGDVSHPRRRAVAVEEDVHPLDGITVKRFNL